MVAGPIEKVRVYRLEAGSRELIPVVTGKGSGLQLQETVELSSQLIRNPGSTFIADVTGDAMRDALIASPARLIIDRSEVLCNNDIVLALVDGAFKVRRYNLVNGTVYLRPENAGDSFTTYSGKAGSDFEIWGVVTQILVDPRVVFFSDCTG